jgi:hypothetical protein
MAEAVIADMDGTLADVRGIRHHVLGGPTNGHHKNFDAFHREAVDCPPNQWVIDELLEHHAAGRAVLIVTAREARHRNSTAFWLAMHGVPSDAMWMRANCDYRPDRTVKREILAKIRARYRVVHAYDDNPNILALWESERIPVTVVPGWDVGYAARAAAEDAEDREHRAAMRAPRRDEEHGNAA